MAIPVNSIKNPPACMYTYTIREMLIDGRFAETTIRAHCMRSENGRINFYRHNEGKLELIASFAGTIHAYLAEDDLVAPWTAR